MVMMSRLSDAHNAFSSYCVSSSLILSLMKMSLMTSLMMMVLGPFSPPVCSFLHFLNYPLIVLVDFHVTESLNMFVVSVEYIQFTAQKLLKFQVQNSQYDYCRLSFCSLFQNCA